MDSIKWLSKFEKHPLFSILEDSFITDEKIVLKGSKGSFLNVLMSSLQIKKKRKHLIIANDQEEAAYIFNDIQNLLGKTKALYYPSTSKSPYEQTRIQNANIVQRAEVLSELNNDKKKFVVTYPEALLEKVITKKELTQNSHKIKVGDNLPMDFLIDVLFEYDFTREQFVVEPGQFAVRGGLVDIWSYSYDKPFRIEYFGDDIESIRAFDPSSQLSVGKYEHIQIVPNILDKIIQEEQTSIIEFIGLSSIVWIKDIQFTLDKIDSFYQKAVDTWSKIETESIQRPPNEMYISKKVLIEIIQKNKVIEYGGRQFYPDATTLTFNTLPQPNFNKNFTLLIEDLRNNKSINHEVNIISDNPKQIERIHSILGDHEKSQNKNISSISFTPQYFTLHEGFIDKDTKTVCYTDHQIFDRYHRFRVKDSLKKSNQSLTIKELTGLKKGDFVTHIDYGIGIFDGLEIIDQNGKKSESIRLLYKDRDLLYVGIQSLHRISKYSGKEGKEPVLNKLGTNTWKTKKANTKKKVKKIAYDLIKLYARRKATKGVSFSKDSYLQTELEASFLFEDTPDQVTSTIAVKKDMEKLFPMDRLICGDVGFGKTEIAIRAAFKAATDGKQVAILVPTTILAFQHYRTFSTRLKDFPVTVDYINRFRTTKEQKETLKRLEKGEIDIIIGTHRLAGKDIQYNDLGLLIIDEEQKFGVSVKDKLKTLKANLDTLTLTATPIPRTLQFSLLGARDLSVINTPPPNRYPIETSVIGFNEENIRDAISYELARGGQAYFIHNRIENIKEVSGVLQRLVPNAKIGIGHGQMEGRKLESMMMDFMNGDFDVLVATTIIESGLDITNANTIIINQAQNFGLSDLHQMRGRVGRSNKKAFCFLVTPPQSSLTPEARKRLRALEEFSDLGSGFNIAMRDLDIRGAGDLLGGEQSGFISDIGYETYQKILDEAIQELKEGEFKELYAEELKEENKIFVKDCIIETDMEILIPTTYVNAVDERLRLYKKLNDIRKEDDLQNFIKNLQDRFGNIPHQTEELISIMRLKWLAQNIGLERLYMKNRILRGYFVSDPTSNYFQSEKFGRILRFIQNNSKSCKMKELKGKLTITFNQITSIEDAFENLRQIDSAV